MVKEKINSVRTYDEDGYRRRAACLCFKDESEQEILLVSSSKHKDRWVVPGGGIEPMEEPTLAAVREALEEAGAKGRLGRKIGDFENKEKKHRTSLYAFIVTDLLDEWEDGLIMGRRRQWFSIVDAKDHLAHKPVQVTYLEVLPKDLNGVVKRSPAGLASGTGKLAGIVQLRRPTVWIGTMIKDRDLTGWLVRPILFYDENHPYYFETSMDPDQLE